VHDVKLSSLGYGHLEDISQGYHISSNSLIKVADNLIRSPGVHQSYWCKLL